MEFVAMEEELRPPGGSQLLAWTKLGLESATPLHHELVVLTSLSLSFLISKLSITSSLQDCPK